MRWRRDQVQVVDPKATRRSVEGTAVGNFMEWYDFGVYGFIATTIAQVFYPGNSASAANLIATFGTLAASFAVRPLGGFAFGLLGDRIGRRPVLIVTILLMTAGTTATGILPGYHAIGIWAPILLIVARVLVGLSTGGEFVGAMTYLGERAPDRRRGELAGYLPMGMFSGFVTAAGVVAGLRTCLSPEDMLRWGWRIPLLLSVPLGVIALFLRLRIKESPDYQQPGEDQTSSGEGGGQQVKRTVVEQWKPLLVCIGLVMPYNVASYVLTGYLPTYFEKVVNLGQTAGLVMILLVLVTMLAAVVFVARFSDLIGAKPILWVGCGLLVVAAVPAFLLIRFGANHPVRLLGVLLIGAMVLALNGTQPSLLPALFPTEVRFAALAAGFNVSTLVFGGTTPLVAEALVAGTGNAMMPAYMLIVSGVVSAVALLFTPETAGKRLPGSAPSVENEQEARAVAEGRSSG
jgi:MHS family proline/betaine transporter-like MFS transporter